jgi:hypothetical protein
MAGSGKERVSDEVKKCMVVFQMVNRKPTLAASIKIYSNFYKRGAIAAPH